jgi:hypothetical protein
VERGDRSLTVFPYPDGRRFTVVLALEKPALRAGIRTVRVHALERRSRRDLGPEDTRIDEPGRIGFFTSVPSAVAPSHTTGWGCIMANIFLGVR